MIAQEELFQQLSDHIRLLTYRLVAVADQPLCVAEIVDILQKPQYAVSRALRQLLRAGLLEEERRGRLVYYRPRSLPFTNSLLELILTGIDEDSEWRIITDRLRWRLEIREDDECVVTYHKEEKEMSDKPSVLFVCVHNSARSQMAEEFLRAEAGDELHVESAGLEPGTLNPRVVTVLKEVGIDISGKETRDVFEVYRSGRSFSYVITVCSREAEEKCPIFPGPGVRLNWPFDDPSAFTGTEEEILEQTRAVRDEIKTKVHEFLDTYHRRHAQ